MIRLGTANTYDNSLANLTNRHSDLAALQEQLTSGKKVVRPSDDPAAAAQAERALTRITRIENEQRALGRQRNSASLVESTLGESVNLLQSMRDLVLSVGNGAFTADDRATVVQQLRGMRDQLLNYANRKDTEGVPMFGGLGSTDTPFTDSTTGVTYHGVTGQKSSTTVSIPSVLDGQAVWMSVPSGNGVFKVEPGGSNTGDAWANTGQVTHPTLLTGHNYTVTFNVSGGAITYDVVDATTSAAVVSGQPYVNNRDIEFDGLSFRVNGTPANGDTLQVEPSTSTDLFSVLDAAIAGIANGTSQGQLQQTAALAVTQMDNGMDRLLAARGFVGDLLNRADVIDTAQQTRTLQLEADRSRAEDLDMVKGVSDFQKAQTAYEASLRSYSQIQRLSLFNFLG